jgi:hypothetical protein
MKFYKRLTFEMLERIAADALTVNLALATALVGRFLFLFATRKCLLPSNAAKREIS